MPIDPRFFNRDFLMTPTPYAFDVDASHDGLPGDWSGFIGNNPGDRPFPGFDPFPLQEFEGVPGLPGMPDDPLNAPKTDKPSDVFGSQLPTRPEVGINVPRPSVGDSVTGGASEGGLQRVGGIATPSTSKEPAPTSLRPTAPSLPSSRQTDAGDTSQPGAVLSRLTASPSIYNVQRKTPMTGRAGGLLGGGLGVPSRLGAGTSQSSSLIAALMQILGSRR